MNLYFVRDWQMHFETNETRKLVKLKWWPKPNKHDGLGFRKMTLQKNRCELYAAWNLIVDLASKTQPRERRGFLERDGIPMSPGDMGVSAGFPGEIFETALAFFSSSAIGWLGVTCEDSPGVPGESPGVPGTSPAEGREGIERIEGKKEWNGASLSSILDHWNSTAEFSRCLIMSDKRRRSLQSRLKEKFFSENWKSAINKICKSDFCKGKNDRGWKASFDWFIQPDTVPKIIEGKYDNRSKPNEHQDEDIAV